MRRNLQKTKFQTLNTNKGITLIALVITIIVLLILAGVAINMAINSDGLFGKANEAAESWNTAVERDEQSINNLLNKIDEMFPVPMITKWNIASGDTVKIYLYDTADGGDNELENNTNVTIDWGDGKVETYTSSNLQYNAKGEGYVSHTYSIANAQTKITITGQCNTIAMIDNTQLTSIEQWGNTGSVNYCFYNSSKLKTVATPDENTFENVTSFCTSTGLSSVSGAGMFSGCISLTTIPAGIFANCANVTDFIGTFSRCSSLTTIPEELFANCVNVTNFAQTFSRCSSLTAIPEELFTNCVNVTNFVGTFSNCSLLTAIPEGLFANCVNVTNFSNTFEYCSVLEVLPATLFDNCLKVTEFQWTFSNCSSLEGNSIPLWERWEDKSDDSYYISSSSDPKKPSGYQCYSGCSGLTDYAAIPTGWK